MGPGRRSRADGSGPQRAIGMPTFRNTLRLLAGLLRQSLFGHLARNDDVNDADRLSHGPAMRAVTDSGGSDRRAASTSQMGRFEVGWLTSEANLAALVDLSGAGIDSTHARRLHAVNVLERDRGVSETQGGQGGSADNGHFGYTCSHPLPVFNQFDDLERCALLVPAIARCQDRMKRQCLRAVAGFANPEVRIAGSRGLQVHDPAARQGRAPGEHRFRHWSRGPGAGVPRPGLDRKGPNSATMATADRSDPARVTRAPSGLQAMTDH